MKDFLARSWWMLALRGTVAIVFGAIALALPGLSLLAFLMVFTAYALVGGAASMVGAVRHRREDSDWWMPFLFGLIAVGAGIIALIRPGLTLYVLVLLIGAYALAGGVLDIAMAIRLRKVLRHEWLLLVNGLVSILFGVLVFVMPDVGILAVAWMIGIYALLSGVLLLALAFRLRQPRVGVRAGERRIGERRMHTDRRAAAH
jgi:uncharacterized membrane protein HdeD (DUF308 family)